MPTVNALFGTFLISLSKNLEFANIVSSHKVLIRVTVFNEEPGSLNET